MNTSAASAATPRDRRIVSPVTVAVVVVLVAVLTVAGIQRFRDLERSQERQAELEAEISDTVEEVRALERRIERLKHDPMLQERLAREELGLARPGEMVIVLPRRAVIEPPALEAPRPNPPAGPPGL